MAGAAGAATTRTATTTGRITAEVDLVASDDEGYAVVRVVEVGQLLIRCLTMRSRPGHGVSLDVCANFSTCVCT